MKIKKKEKIVGVAPLPSEQLGPRLSNKWSSLLLKTWQILLLPSKLSEKIVNKSNLT